MIMHVESITQIVKLCLKLQRQSKVDVIMVMHTYLPKKQELLQLLDN